MYEGCRLKSNSTALAIQGLCRLVRPSVSLASYLSSSGQRINQSAVGLNVPCSTPPDLVITTVVAHTYVEIFILCRQSLYECDLGIGKTFKPFSHYSVFRMSPFSDLSVLLFSSTVPITPAYFVFTCRVQHKNESVPITPFSFIFLTFFMQLLFSL